MIATWRFSPVAAVAILAVSHALVLYPTLRPNVQWLGPVITHFASEANEAWLTIDDGPTDDTPAVLDMLDRKGVKATFFVKGQLVAARPDLVKLMLERGHTVANHSQTHPSGTFWCLMPQQVAREVEQCNAALETATGVAPRLFRAPVGMKNPFVHPVLARHGLQLIGWTARGFDAVVSDPDEVSRRIVPHLVPGAILVMHQGRAFSVRVLERVIEDVQARGYRFVIPSDDRLKTNR